MQNSQNCIQQDYVKDGETFEAFIREGTNKWKDPRKGISRWRHNSKHHAFNYVGESQQRIAGFGTYQYEDDKFH